MTGPLEIDRTWIKLLSREEGGCLKLPSFIQVGFFDGGPVYPRLLWFEGGRVYGRRFSREWV
ncbi:hypothetical protein X474_10850 [Dethiosulfatarculus sandiegensis]|uniref:Uncharacterized protein n=1 Tax=Dethiosulfatarculus sandiegensis TaxID=1429043 RepID=A0A0D2HUC0_9BACT|nr:hypothetical protein X474_10850 [Dethiosulfatarculus sandiegensis]